MEVAKILTPSESDHESQPSSEVFSNITKCEVSSPASSPEENGIYQQSSDNNNCGFLNLTDNQFPNILSKLNKESFRWITERSSNFVSDLVQQQLEKRLSQIENQNAQIHRHILSLTASLVRLEGFLESSGIFASNNLKRKFPEEQQYQHPPSAEHQNVTSSNMDTFQQGCLKNNQIYKNLNLIMDAMNQKKVQQQPPSQEHISHLKNPLFNMFNNTPFVGQVKENKEKETLNEEEESKRTHIKEILSKFTSFLSDQRNGLQSNGNGDCMNNNSSNGNRNVAKEEPNQPVQNKNKWDDNRGYRHTTNARNDEPVMILNPTEPREMFVGGVHPVRLPVWAYRKCLGMVRGAPHELGPRLCLRLLQSLFSLNYLVTHNYNGSGGKTPIDPTVMSAVLQQAQLQFGSDHFFTEPMALGKLRDYLNNAFRVMAFRQRKGERVRSPFWNEDGEPVLPLDPPVGYNIGKTALSTPNIQPAKYLKSD